MSGHYAYSFDREQYHGVFETRELATQAGAARAVTLPEPPGTVYVAQMVGADPHCEGHAESLVQAMRRRVRQETSDQDFLRRVDEHQLASLDEAVARVLRDWLAGNGLAPAAMTPQRISEHALPDAWRARYEPDRVAPAGR